METLAFKFKYLDDNGNQTGFFSKRGSCDETTLILDDQSVPIEAVVRTRQRFERLIIELQQLGGGTAAMAIAITRGDAAKLASELNRRCSTRSAQLRREALEKEGKGGTFRAEPCPVCHSQVECTGHAPTAQIHCLYCDGIATLKEPQPRGEANLRLCDECGLYANPRPFTAFYFYFLFVVYGWRYQRKYICHSCMRGAAWKMLFYNLPFVLGVPMAIGQLVRAYKAGGLGCPDFPGLDTANALTKKGRAAEADKMYDEIVCNLAAAAGVNYNRGLAWMKGGYFDQAIPAFEKALAECGNLAPAAVALRACYQQTGQDVKLARLEAEWGEKKEA